MGNKEIRKTLKKLFINESEVRLNSEHVTYLGKISRITSSIVYLSPYMTQENLPGEGGQYLQRARIEKNFEIPIPMAGIIPEKLSEGYMDYFAKARNYFSRKMMRNETLRNILFGGYPLPDQKEIDLIERRAQDSKDSKTSQKGVAGFNYPNKDIQI